VLVRYRTVGSRRGNPARCAAIRRAVAACFGQCDATDTLSRS
jgi:hypothetical protein